MPYKVFEEVSQLFIFLARQSTVVLFDFAKL